jgi:hypothetical protein
MIFVVKKRKANEMKMDRAAYRALALKGMVAE